MEREESSFPSGDARAQGVPDGKEATDARDGWSELRLECSCVRVEKHWAAD